MSNQNQLDQQGSQSPQPQTPPTIEPQQEPTNNSDNFEPKLPAPDVRDPRDIALANSQMQLRQMQEELQALRNQIHQVVNKPAPEPEPQAAEDFFRDPYNALKQELARAVEPINSQISEFRRSSQLVELKNYIRALPQFAPIWDRIEQQYDMAMNSQQQVNTQVAIAAATLAAGNLFVSNGFQGVPATEYKPAWGNQPNFSQPAQPITQPQLQAPQAPYMGAPVHNNQMIPNVRPSAPPAPVSQPTDQKVNYNWNEFQLADMRRRGLSEQDYYNLMTQPNFNVAHK